MASPQEVPKSNVGIKAFLDHALQSYEKLPMLEIVFEKFVRQLTTSLRYLTSEPIEIQVLDFNSSRFGNYFKTIKPKSSIVVFNAIEWENLGLLVLDNKMVFTFVDILLGGGVSGAGAKVSPNKVLTSIEQGIARQVIDVMLHDLGIAFDQISSASFVFERLENNPNFATIARAGDAVVVLKLRAVIDQIECDFDLIIPYKTLEPVKEKMQQVFLGDKFGHDANWERSMVRAVSQTYFPLEAVITDKPSTLWNVANLKVGDTIMMDHKHDQDIVVRAGDIDLFLGQIGKVEDKVAINVTKVVER